MKGDCITWKSAQQSLHTLQKGQFLLNILPFAYVIVQNCNVITVLMMTYDNFIYLGAWSRLDILATEEKKKGKVYDRK